MTTAFEANDGLYMSARYLRGLVDYVRARNVPVSPVLEALGLSDEQLRSPDVHIPHALQDRAFAAAEQITGDNNVGLHAGAAANVLHFGVVGQLAMTCRTGGELLDLQVRYQSLIGNGVRSACKRLPHKITLELNIERALASRHAIEYTLAAQLSLARMLAGPTFRPTEIKLSHARPTHADEQERVFGCPVAYDCAQPCVEFPIAVETLVLAGSEPEVRQALESAARRRFEVLQAQLQQEDDEIRKCQLFIIDKLSNGAPTVEEAANALKTSVRTLQRRLEAHGVSYRDVVDGARQQLAERLIADETLSLLDVAFLTGFSEQSSFTRAFRRWFQRTPREMRAKLTR